MVYCNIGTLRTDSHVDFDNEVNYRYYYFICVYSRDLNRFSNR